MNHKQKWKFDIGRISRWQNGVFYMQAKPRTIITIKGGSSRAKKSSKVLMSCKVGEDYIDLVQLYPWT